MRPVKDAHGDLTTVERGCGGVFVCADQISCSAPHRTVMRYTPKQARKLAKQLYRAAAEAEAEA